MRKRFTIWEKRIGKILEKRSKKQAAALLFAILQLLSLAACSGLEEGVRDWKAAGDMNSAYSEQIQTRCQEFADTNDLSGLAVAVFDNGQASFINFGLTDKDGSAITEHTRFEIASITKTFTSLLMAQMAADSDIRLRS